VNVLLMAEGEPQYAFTIDREHANKLSEWINEYNEYESIWYRLTDDECIPFNEWLLYAKQVLTTDLEIEVVSLVDGYWYT
jgi:hypothetical protein